MKRCTRCVMDTTDENIVFDQEGICNHCISHQKKLKSIDFTENQRKVRLDAIVSKIKGDRKGEYDYDCIIGVSGGVDSSYTALIVKQLGLRPLAVHMDNGWNSELAVHNIQKVLSKLDIDLYTRILDWNEFKELQLAFLRASTPDAEIPTDHAIVTVLFETAIKHKIKYIITGYNIVTEAIMPPEWSRGHSDWKYISGVNKKFGTRKLKDFPHRNFWKIVFHKRVRKLQRINILDLVGYDKASAKDILMDELEWEDYGGKHYESIYTRFFQGYILPRKFNIDKRLAHLSALISSGQMTRDVGLKELEKHPYPSESLMNEDYYYVMKKMELDKYEFQEIMELPIKTFFDYPSNETSILFRFLFRIKRLMRGR